MRDILFWALMALAIGTFLLDIWLRRLPGESYAHAALFINQRDMEWGVFLSAFTYVLLATRVSASSAWWALGTPVPLSVTSWWLLSVRSPRQRKGNSFTNWLTHEKEPSSNVKRLDG